MTEQKDLLARTMHAANQAVLKPTLTQPTNIAVVGATGVVGRETLSILEERDFPVGNLKLLASERSAGEQIEFHGEDITVQVLAEEAFDGVDVAFFLRGRKHLQEVCATGGKAGRRLHR